MHSITVVGDGAVGTAVAVALSSKYPVVLAGPPGSGSETERFSVTGALEASAELQHMPINRITDRSLVIAALKSFDIAGAVPFISRFAEGRPICLSNGMGLESAWGNLFPQVDYAVLTAGFRKTSAETVTVTPGEFFCTPDSMCIDLFSDLFVPVHVTECIEDIRWAKWYTNSIVNPLGALTGLSNNLLESSEMGHLIPVLEKELKAFAPSEQAVQLGRDMLRWILKHSSNRCSMLQDLDAGNRTEIDFLTGRAVHFSPAARMLSNMVKART